MDTYNVIAYPLSFSDNPQRDRLENSNQVLLPPEILQNEDIEFPVFFTLENKEVSVNVGVLEFTEIPGVVYIPWHILTLLKLQEGDKVDIKMINESLPSATEITLMPHEHEFITLNDPKVVLEQFISKNYPILSLNDIIRVNYLNKIYNLSVTKLEPAKSVKMINCDVNLSFERAFDYVSPEPTPEPSPVSSPVASPVASRNKLLKNFKSVSGAFVPFGGKGNRLGDN